MGALSIHRACRNSESPIEVIQFLVDQGPATVYHEDYHFKLSIRHPLCRTPLVGCRENPTLLGLGEPAITMINCKNHSLLMLASLASAPVEVCLWYLIKSQPCVCGPQPTLHFYSKKCSRAGHRPPEGVDRRKTS